MAYAFTICSPSVLDPWEPEIEALASESCFANKRGRQPVSVPERPCSTNEVQRGEHHQESHDCRVVAPCW